MTRALLLLPLALAGCALDTTETASMDELSRMTNKRSLERLGVEFETAPETREETAKALVRRGRAWFAEHPDSHYDNLVIHDVGETAASVHIEPACRAKAVWVLAEIGDRSAKAAIGGAYAGDSTAVGEEVSLGLDKLGFTSEAHEMELLKDGYTTVEGYDPDTRGHVEEAE